ncbi:hypothetical protein K9K77_03265 [Candidatus Babeliales bacterium]|nr:hypothetical protein [Candidatus Babeliales bacterium]
MIIKKNYIIGLGALCSGMIFFCLYQELLIIHWGMLIKPEFKKEIIAERKKINLYFWKDERWKKESVEIMWSKDQAATLHYALNQWLNLLDEEEILDKKVLLQYVSLNDSESTVYLSFDRYPFDLESSTHQKHMIIESLLKTVREADIKIPFFHFLVHHKPIIDSHLDFTHPWPIHGFLNS